MNITHQSIPDFPYSLDIHGLTPAGSVYVETIPNVAWFSLNTESRDLYYLRVAGMSEEHPLGRDNRMYRRRHVTDFRVPVDIGLMPAEH